MVGGMLYGLWFMVSAVGGMLYGLWFMVSAVGGMVYGLWFMVYGLWLGLWEVMVYGLRILGMDMV